MISKEDKDNSECNTTSNAIDISPNKDGGVLKEIIKEGEGTTFPSIKSNLTVHYKGTLTDGTVFDSSYDKGTPLNFVLGVGKCMTFSWDIGLATMKKGEVALLTCKPKYAYGENGMPPKIPPNSTLIFEIKLIDWTLENLSKKNDNGILRRVIQKGVEYSKPDQGGLVKVHITGIYNGKVFDDRSLSFNLGEGCEVNVIEGIEIALLQFNKKEKSSLEIKPEYAFKHEGNAEFQIPPDATVTYEVTLEDFERVKQTWEMDSSEKLSQAELYKEKGIKYFKEEKYLQAANFFKDSLNYISSDVGFSEDEETLRNRLLIAVRLNLAITYLKLNQNYEAIKECDEALKLDSNNIKGYFRRGQAYFNISEPDKAKLDFEAVLKIEPNNKLASSQILACCRKISEQKKIEQKFYANMFSKYTENDKKALA
ncbi:FK506-binding protein, putative [Pediculus humanus corporis]|uniref:peptidylprolyl isomerase n=1 Tax=Pediculus humanus subsp. corporis TaxID=121224 RepID=E0W032_PEDHC|nr:FK506-binding protein, putative [Pediculus humanus corporis]EEB18988.1 FK506-binding protein, putative [Pediculus humanus corporis]